MPQIRELWEYPIKSCPGIRVEVTTLGLHGPALNRLFMVVDSKGVMVTQRTAPKLALLKVSKNNSEDTIIVSTREGSILVLDLYATPRESIEVRLHDQPPCIGFTQSAEADQFFSDYLGKKCRVVRYYRYQKRIVYSQHLGRDLDVMGFPDKYPLLVVSTGSLKMMSHEMGMPFDRRRVRPNIVISANAHVESAPEAKFGLSQVILQWAKWCGRCSIPEVDPDTGVMDRSKKVTNAFKSIHQTNDKGEPIFGSNYIYSGAGMIRTGDPLYVQ
jgi:uncharacterized protein YcbX